MNLNPVIVIPTFWCPRRSSAGAASGPIFDYATPVDKPGNLGRCLESLKKVDGLGRVVVLVAAEGGVENQAAERVRGILSSFPDMELAMVAAPELRHIHRRMEQIGMGALASCATLSGYGAIRNLGILAASIFGHDTVIFMSDDVVVDRPDFLERALYGIGAQTPNGGLVTAKTGYYFDAEGDRLARPDKRWYRSSWNKAASFNAYLKPALEGPRLSRANTASASCLVLHAETFGSVSFDPWITRGEDTDYVINCRMYHQDVWLDNKFSVQRMPDERRDMAANFEQDVIRWYYEGRKVEFAKAQIDLMRVEPSTMQPYPGEWMTGKVSRKALITSLMSAIGASEHGEYFRIARSGRKKAAEYARDNCSRYFEFQRQWPMLVRGLWDCTSLATQLSGARHVQSGNPAFTGRFSAVSVD